MNKTLALLATLFVLALAACQSGAPNVAEIPAGKAYANGETIYFTHTEASDKDVADLLTKMMKSPVLYVRLCRRRPRASPPRCTSSRTASPVPARLTSRPTSSTIHRMRVVTLHCGASFL